MTLTLAFSPCPNDCFMFDAMVHGRIDTEGLEFDVRLLDIDALNAAAFAGEFDATKLSFHAYAVLRRSLRAARCGQRARQRLRAAADLEARDSARRGGRRAACASPSPGGSPPPTSCAVSRFRRRRTRPPMIFSDIEPAVLDGRFDAGLIIHENRFTYEAKGLKKIIDLGEFWEAETGAPIPLGGIVVRRALADGVQQALNRVMRRSVEFAFAQPRGEPAVRPRARAGNERRGDVQAHRPLRERVLGGPRERGAAGDRR